MPIGFGIVVEPVYGFSYKMAHKLATTAEECKYNSFWISDHFFPDTSPDKTNCLESWTLLSAIAMATCSIKVGTLVTCNNYRNPALLAKMATTVDEISNGRLILGIGSGWKENEYVAYGYPFPPVKDRMDQLEEALQIIRKLWTEQLVTFLGKHYKIHEAYHTPKPVQQPHPPILVGGSGRKRTLRIVAEYADWCNIAYWVLDEAEELLAVLRKHCATVGRNYDEITKSMTTYAYVAKDEIQLKKHLTSLAQKHSITVEQVRNNLTKYPGAFVGLGEDVRKRYEYLVELGFTHFQVKFPFPDDVEHAIRFAKEVMRPIQEKR